MVLVSLVGDFYSSIIPVFYHYKNQITKHIIIYNEHKNDKVIARKLINGSEVFNEHHHLNIETIDLKIDEDSQEAIDRAIKTIDELCPNKEELFINVTDGLSNVIVLMGEYFRETPASLITYDRFDNEMNIIKAGVMSHIPQVTSVPIKDHFLLKAVTIEKASDRHLADLHEEFLNRLFITCGGAIDEIEDIPEVFVNKQMGFLFEFYVYNLLKRLNYDDIVVGAIVHDYYTQENFIPNEFDILIMKNNHLHMIECKYQNKEPSVSYIYKAISVEKVIDEDGKSIIVTNSDTYNITDDTHFNHKLTTNYKRAKNNNIILRGSPINNGKEFIRDVDSFFGLQTEGIEVIEDGLDSYFDKECNAKIKEINSALCELFGLDVNFFSQHSTSRLLSYKTNYIDNGKIWDLMEHSELRHFIKMIHKFNLKSAKAKPLKSIYKFFTRHIQKSS